MYCFYVTAPARPSQKDVDFPYQPQSNLVKLGWGKIRNTFKIFGTFYLIIRLFFKSSYLRLQMFET